MNSTDVTVSQHNLYCVIRRQEYLCFGQIKYVHRFETSGHVLIITANIFRRPSKFLAALLYEQYRQWLFETVARGWQHVLARIIMTCSMRRANPC